jgi:hypothetical protein
MSGKTPALARNKLQSNNHYHFVRFEVFSIASNTNLEIYRIQISKTAEKFNKTSHTYVKKQAKK